MPNFGDRVHVRPRPGLRVQRGENLFDQFLPEEGAEVTWDSFHQGRMEDGSLLLRPQHYHAERLDVAIGALQGQRDALPEKDEKRADIDAQIKALSEQRAALDRPAGAEKPDAAPEPPAVPEAPRLPRTQKKENG